MFILVSALVILMVFATIEYLIGERRKSWSSYIAWFFIILGSMYFAKAYGYEDMQDHHFYQQDQHFDEHNFYQIEDKFVPEGTPDHYINDDNTLSKECLKVIRSTDKKTAKISFEIHKDKGISYFKDAENGCCFLPKLKMREAAKMAFTTAIAAFPGHAGVRLVLVTLSLLGQYGICCIDEYFDIEYNLNMAHYHFKVADAYHDHMESKGWLK